MSERKPMRRAPKVRIEVSKDVIDKAVARHSGHCVFADAIGESLLWARFIAVDIQTVRFSDPTKRERYVYLTPRRLQQAIIDFDQGDRPEPFSFSLYTGQTIPFGQSDRQNELDRKRDELKRAEKIKELEGEAKPSKKAELVSSRAPGAIPGIVGGVAPPHPKDPGVPRGMRREFGLRAFNR
jgi:hypothetical protein